MGPCEKHRPHRPSEAEQERAELVARANQVPGLTAALDEARWKLAKAKDLAARIIAFEREWASEGLPVQIEQWERELAELDQ
jgi:uncharacterized protein YigA (DUF484 family)